MKGFMIQGGDPTDTGKGGGSIWGGYFPDELVPEHKYGYTTNHKTLFSSLLYTDMIVEESYLWPMLLQILTDLNSFSRMLLNLI